MPTVAAFYRFTPFDDPAALRGMLEDVCAAQDVRGTLILAKEGINGTLAGGRAAVGAVLNRIRSLPGCADLEWRESEATQMPFGRMKVRVKPEIVTLGAPGADPARAGGRYVDPAAWNALIAAPDVAAIDTRNAYETAIGTFEGAIVPKTKRFRDFPAWWAEHRDRFRGKRIAMFCTGGIRCEKSTAFLRTQGIEEVHHLEGGILKYLEQVPARESLWRGGCFVFDERVAVGHGLAPLAHTLCRACRRPVAPRDRTRPEFEPGVRCHNCVDEYGETDRARFRERQRQLDLAAARGQAHVGAPARIPAAGPAMGAASQSGEGPRGGLRNPGSRRSARWIG